MTMKSNGEISGPAKTLLVVDDDPMVRDVATQILRLEGYAVLEARGAAEALLLARQAAAIHLLIADFSMPELDGLDLTRRLRVLHPAAPVLMVSGSLPLVKEATEDLDRVDLLPKPFRLAELLQRVRKLLDAAVPVPIRKQWCCD